MIAQPTTPPRFLTTTESLHLFTIIWQNGQDAHAARETLIAHNLRAVRNVILKQPALYWYDEEDASQEAYLLLTTCIEKVPPGLPDPGPYLYKTICKTIYGEYSSSGHRSQSLDATIPGTENTTLHEILAAPAPPGPSAIHAHLLSALQRLPLGQQQALEAFFHIPDFQPRANARYALHSGPKSSACPSARHAAYQELRLNPILRAGIEPLRKMWSSTPAKTLKYYRLLHAWSQREIAEALGVSMSLVGMWENGARHPGASHREKLCQLYGVTAEQLGLRDTRKQGLA